jgi:hypothetical protein
VKSKWLILYPHTTANNFGSDLGVQAYIAYARLRWASAVGKWCRSNDTCLHCIWAHFRLRPMITVVSSGSGKLMRRRTWGQFRMYGELGSLLKESSTCYLNRR